MKYTYRFDVRFQDAGRRDRIRLSRFVDMAIDAIVNCADDNGDGLDKLREHGAAWVLAKLGVEVLKVPCRGDKLEYETWCERSGRGLSTRNIRIWKLDEGVEGGRVLMSQVHTIWASIDIQSREVVDVYALGVPRREDGERMRLLRLDDEIGADDQVTEYHHAICYSDLDSNGHCNSGRYFELMLNAVEPDESFVPSRFEVTYAKEAVLGQPLTVKWTRDAHGYRFAVVDSSGEPCCHAAIEVANF